MGEADLDPAAVEVGVFVPTPPARVWQALTDPDLLARWLLRPVGLTPRVGTHFVFDNVEPPCEIACEVLVAEAPIHLRYSWVYPVAEPPSRWIVDWSLDPQGRGTRLLLTQTGFDMDNHRQRMSRNAMERGWKQRLPKLVELFS